MASDGDKSTIKNNDRRSLRISKIREETDRLISFFERKSEYNDMVENEIDEVVMKNFADAASAVVAGVEKAVETYHDKCLPIVDGTTSTLPAPIRIKRDRLLKVLREEDSDSRRARSVTVTSFLNLLKDVARKILRDEVVGARDDGDNNDDRKKAAASAQQ